LYANVLWLR